MKTIKANYKVIIGVLVFIGLMWMVISGNKAENEDAERLDSLRKDASAKLNVIAEKSAGSEYLALKENQIVSDHDLVLSFGKLEKANMMIANRYNERYHTYEPERDEVCITGKVKIKSDTKLPMLPSVVIYKLEDGLLRYVSNMNYYFSRWEDYGTFLGNYTDKGNDFASTEEISFEVGAMIPESEYLNSALFIVVTKECMARRVEERFNEPPVSYKFGDCMYKSEISPIHFTEDEYTLVKVLNKEKIK